MVPNGDVVLHGLRGTRGRTMQTAFEALGLLLLVIVFQMIIESKALLLSLVLCGTAALLLQAYAPDALSLIAQGSFVAAFGIALPIFVWASPFILVAGFLWVLLTWVESLARRNGQSGVNKS